MRKELAQNIKQIQDKIKLKLYEHGTQERISKETGISTYLIRTTVKSKYPDLELLSKIEKAIS